MPVKVKCPNCEKSLNAPDTARGKAVRCPECQTKVPVPAAKVKAKKEEHPDDVLMHFDEAAAEDEKRRVCPRCAKPVEEEDEVCENCGTDLTTRKLTKKAKRKKLLAGAPDPQDFYKRAWPDSFQFVRENLRLVHMTGIAWAILLAAGMCCFVLAMWCTNVPPMLFYFGMTALCALGMNGWQDYLSNQVIVRTLRKQPFDTIKFDFFGATARGLKVSIWPSVMMFPLFFPVFMLGLIHPIAQVHMAMPYTYKGWVGWDMTQITLKHFAPAFMWVITAVLVTLVFAPFAGIAPGIVGYFYSSVNNTMINQPCDYLSEQVWGKVDHEHPVWIIFWIMFIFLYSALIAPFITYPLAFPTVFLVRMNALLGYYFQDSLELVTETKFGVTAPFFVRSLAWLIDCALIGVSCSIMIAVLGVLGYGADAAMEDPKLTYTWTLAGVGCLLIPLFLYFYHVSSEAGPYQSTIGMRSMGIMVVREDNPKKKIDTAIAQKRFMWRVLSSLLLNFPLLLAVGETCQTLHDSRTKTLVVWHGDD